MTPSFEAMVRAAATERHAEVAAKLDRVGRSWQKHAQQLSGLDPARLTWSQEADGLHGALTLDDVATFREKGTAPHTIRPRNAQALLLGVGGSSPLFARRVEHPGTKPQPFVQEALDAALREQGDG